MVDVHASRDVHLVKGATTWRIGSQAEVDWIDGRTRVGMDITSAIPPVFDAYATIVVPHEDTERDARDKAVLALLTDASPGKAWWLGYLDDGGSDLVFAGAPKVRIGRGSTFVLVEAGPSEAATWRADYSSFASLSSRGPLPELMFPSDRSWLLHTLWDDDWSCLGGPTHLIDGFMANEVLETRAVVVGEDATPPGHVAR